MGFLIYWLVKKLLPSAFEYHPTSHIDTPADVRLTDEEWTRFWSFWGDKVSE